MELNEDEKKNLLKIAREAIEAKLQGSSIPEVKYKSKNLKMKSGVFVTLKINNDLRGCIGYIEPLFPLAKAVQDVAIKAAFEDNRFYPLTLSEFKAITIEISILTLPEELTNPENVVIGKHGLIIDAGYTRGLLLPQVATEYGWNKEEFLTHTALKAGLPADSWKKKNIKLYTFSVEKIDETVFSK